MRPSPLPTPFAALAAFAIRAPLAWPPAGLLALALSALPAWSQDAAQPPPQRRQGPPAEALQACKSLASGAACEFTTPDGTKKGSCWAPEGRPLACKPKDAPPPRGAGSAASSASGGQR